LPAGLAAGESITVTTTSVPTDPAGRTVTTGDLTFAAVSMSDAKAATVRGAAAATTQQIPNGTGALSTFASNNEVTALLTQLVRQTVTGGLFTQQILMQSMLVNSQLPFA